MKDGVTVIVPAAGIGKRLGLGKNKAFALVGGLPLLALCLKNLSAVAVVNHVVVVVGAGEVEADATAGTLFSTTVVGSDRRRQRAAGFRGQWSGLCDGGNGLCGSP